MPMDKSVPVILLSGQKFLGNLNTPTGLYHFTCIYQDKRLKPLPVWIISLPFDVKRIQQRAFVRIDTKLKIQIQAVADSGETNSHNVFTKDISGGGMQIVSKVPYAIGHKIFIAFELPELGSICTVAEVVRSVKQESEFDVFYIGLKFIDIPERERNKIIKYIFHKQLENRRKGL